MKRLTEWWRWVRRRDWELIELHPTTYAGNFPTQFRPYFWEVWKDKQTGEERVVACQ